MKISEIQTQKSRKQPHQNQRQQNFSVTSATSDKGWNSDRIEKKVNFENRKNANMKSKIKKDKQSLHNVLYNIGATWSFIEFIIKKTITETTETSPQAAKI